MSEQTTEVKIKPLKRKLPHNVFLLTTAAAIVLIGLGIIYLTRMRKTTNSGVCNGQSSSSIYEQADAAIFDPTKLKLKATVDKINADPSSKKDQSCMYIATYYYLSVGDQIKSGESLDYLKKVYKSDDKYVPSLKKYKVLSIPDLEARHSVLEQRAKQLTSPVDKSEIEKKFKENGITL